MYLDSLSRRFGRRSVSYVPFRPAASFEQRAAAFQLVYESYLQSSLGTPNVFRMRVTPFQLLDTSQIFIASELRPVKLRQLPPRYAILWSSPLSGQPVGGVREEVVSTVTLVKDGRLGLPMDAMFQDEVDALRSDGRAVAEVACLADAVSDPRRFLDTFTQMTRLMAQFSRYEGVQNLLISVHPRHAKFYARYFGFRPISNRVAECPHVKDRPAIALNLDFHLYDIEQPRSWERIFGTWEPKERLRAFLIPAGEHHFWREVSRVSCPDSSDLLARTDDPSQRNEMRNQQKSQALEILTGIFSNFCFRPESDFNSSELMQIPYASACSSRQELMRSVPGQESGIPNAHPAV